MVPPRLLSKCAALNRQPFLTETFNIGLPKKIKNYVALKDINTCEDKWANLVSSFWGTYMNFTNNAKSISIAEKSNNALNPRRYRKK